MADTYTQPYLDSNVYIATLKGPETEDAEKVHISASILALAESGSFSIYASTFIEAEVIKAPGEPEPLTEEQEETIAKYLDRDCVVWIDVDRLVARKARQLAPTYGIKPGDAVHVASALRAGCDHFLTWDDKLVKKGPQVESLLLCEPHTTGWQTSYLGLLSDDG